VAGPPEPRRSAAGVDPALLAILVCPADRGPLLAAGDVLYNPRLRKAYRIEDGIPVLLVDQAADVGPEEHERLMTHAGR
jgi:uncharacterized protein YbaR (Trm112 family)